MWLTTIRKTKLVKIMSGVKNNLDGNVQIFGLPGVNLSLPRQTVAASKSLSLLHANKL